MFRRTFFTIFLFLGLLAMPTFAMVCQTNAPWLDMNVEPCNVETFSGVGISQNIFLELKNEFTWDDFDIYLSIPHGATSSIFQRVENVEVNYPIYGEYETCTPCDEIEYAPEDVNQTTPICVMLPDTEAVHKAYISLYGSYREQGYRIPVSFGEFYNDMKVEIIGVNETCESTFVLESINQGTVENGFVLLNSEKITSTAVSTYYKLTLYNSSETAIELQSVLNAPSLSGGAWKFVVVKAGHELSESLDVGDYWYVDPFWWSSGWNFKTQMDVAYPKGLMDTMKYSSEFGGLHSDVAPEKFVGPRTARVILPTGDLANDNKLQSDCDDMRFALEQLPLDHYSYAFPFEAEGGMSYYDNFYLYKNTRYVDDAEGWSSPLELDISRTGNPGWIQHNDYDWEKYAMMFIDDGDSDYFTILNTNSSAFPSLPSPVPSPPLDRTYIIISATLMDALPRTGTYYILDKMNWATSNGWAIGIRHTPEVPNNEYCPVFVNGNGTLNYYEGECHLTTESSYQMTFTVVYDGDDDKLWIVQPDDIEEVISGFRDFSNTTEVFTLSSIGTSSLPLKISSDNPERDFVGKINYIEFVMPGDYLPRWTYISPRMQLLQHGFVELPFEIEGGKDTGNWVYDGACHTSSISSETGFLVSLPYTVRIPESTLDFYQDSVDEEASETSCSDGILFGDCDKIMDGDGTSASFWDATNGSTTWTYSPALSAQAVVVVIDPTSSAGADITIYLNQSTINQRTIQFTNIQPGDVLYSEFRDNIVQSFDTLDVLVSGSAKITEVEVLTSAIANGSEAITFAKKININVTDTSGVSQSGLVVDIPVDTATLISAGTMKSDCSDVRFYNSQGTKLDYFINSGCNTNNTIFEIEMIIFPANSTQTITMYFNSTTLSSESDRYSVAYQYYDRNIGGYTNLVETLNGGCGGISRFTWAPDGRCDSLDGRCWRAMSTSPTGTDNHCIAMGISDEALEPNRGYSLDFEMEFYVDTCARISAGLHGFVDGTTLASGAHDAHLETRHWNNWIGITGTGGQAQHVDDFGEADVQTSELISSTLHNKVVSVEWDSDYARYLVNGVETYSNQTSTVPNSSIIMYPSIGFAWPDVTCSALGLKRSYIYYNYVRVLRFTKDAPNVSVGAVDTGPYVIFTSTEIETVKALVFPTSSVADSDSQVVSVESLSESSYPFNPDFIITSSDISSGTDEVRILIQKPVRLGGFYIKRVSSYGETSAKFIYEDDTFVEVYAGDFSFDGGGHSYVGGSPVDTTMFYNPLPDKKVKDIYVSFHSKGAHQDERWRVLKFIDAPVGAVNFLAPYSIVSAYYGNNDATAPEYNPHLSYMTRAFTPNLLFEFSDDEKTSVIYQSFTGGLASAVSGGNLWTSSLSANPTLNFGTWNGKTFDIEHEFVDEFWKGMITSGLATHARITNLASYSDWGLGNHHCGYGYPVTKDGSETFLDEAFPSPPGSLVNNGGTIWASSEYGCGPCYGQVETKAYNADYSSSMSVSETASHRCSKVLPFNRIELAFKNSNTAKFDWIKWYFTEPLHQWTVSSEEIIGDIDVSVDSVIAVPTQVVSGNYFDVTAYVTSDGLPLGGATCQVIYAGDTYPMSESQTGKYEASAPATFGIETVTVSCSMGASADSGGTTITVTVSEEDYITIDAFTDLTSKLLAIGDKVAPLAFVGSNSFASMACEWYYESTPGSTTAMTSYSGNPFNYGPTAPDVFTFTEDILVKCCRGTYCNTGKMSHKLIETTTPYKAKTIYFGGELPLGGTFAVRNKIMAQGTSTLYGSTDSFSEVIVPLDFANELFGADVFSNPDNNVGGVIQFQGNNYTLTFDDTSQYFISQNITAPSTKAVFNYDVFVYYEVDDSSKIWGHGIGQVYVGSEVPGISVDIIPTSPNVDITPISVEVEVYDIDNATMVDSSCDLTITEDHTGAFIEYDLIQTETGIHSISISDEFLGPATFDVECYPSSTDYTPIDSEVGYTFGSNIMTLTADVNPDQIADGDDITITAITKYGNFQTCGPDCSVWIDDEMVLSSMYCSNINKQHSETLTYNTNESGAHNVRVKCDYGSDHAEATDSFQVSLGAEITLELNPAENTELDPFTVTADIKDNVNAPVEGLLCSAYIFEHMSGVSQTYAMSEVANGLYSKYIDEGWLGDLEVRVTCIDPASEYVIPAKQTSYNVGGYAPYTIGLFTAPQLPAQCSDDLQLQLFLLYREEVEGEYVYPDCPMMTCEISVYDEDGVQIGYMSAVPTLGKLRTAFLDLGGVCGTVAFDITCVDINGTCTGGTRRAEVYLTDRKPEADYCGNGICGRGEFETCDWDCDSFDKMLASSITFGDAINVISYDEIITCRLDRDWADVSRVLPLSYKCGPNGECTTRAMSTSIILMDEVSDYVALPEQLELDFETPTNYIVDFGSMKASMPAETIFRNPAFVSDIQGIYGTYQYPLLLNIETGEDRIRLKRHSPTDIFGAIGAFYSQSYTCEPEATGNCYGGLFLNKTTVTVVEYDSLTCWTSSGKIYAKEMVQSFSYDPIKGEFNVISLIFNWKLWLLLLALAPPAYAGISLLLRKREGDIALQTAMMKVRGGG